MGLILNIETSTSVCSVSLSKDGELVDYLENTEGQKHASLLTVYIEQILDKNNISAKELDAVAVSKGPGSYTGLRIGVSAAKGICYAANIPLISVSTLLLMSSTVVNSENLDIEKNNAIYCPMIDARRMEVYSAFFNSKNETIRDIEANIIDSESFIDSLEKNSIVFFGDGSGKCKETITHKNAVFVENIYPSAKNMGQLSNHKLINNEFEDVAYFEPFYLKDFVATTPKKNVFN